MTVFEIAMEIGMRCVQRSLAFGRRGVGVVGDLFLVATFVGGHGRCKNAKGEKPQVIMRKQYRLTWDSMDFCM